VHWFESVTVTVYVPADGVMHCVVAPVLHEYAEKVWFTHRAKP
jgi:hypothetical protein